MDKVIIVSGFAGSGKSTLAEKLAKEFELRCIHASDLLRQLRDKEIGQLDVDKTKSGSGWWESKEAEEYLKKRAKDERMDRTLDEQLLLEIEKGDVVVDSWTMPWLSRKGYKIWLDASVENRAERIAERDKMELDEVIKKIKERDEQTGKIYKKLYGFELGKDITPFNLVLCTNKMDEDSVFKRVSTEIKSFFGE